MFEFATEFPLALDKNKFFYAIAHDGHQTYLSSGDRQVFTLNDCCCLINQVDTCCSYHTICYDCTLKHFWAASSDRPGVLFCLSEQLKELKTINLSSENLDPLDIDHLFYDANGKQLYLTIKDQVYSTDATGHLQKLFEIKTNTGKLEDICAYNSYFLCLFSRQEENLLSIHALSNGALLEEYRLPDPFKVSSMTFIQDPLNPLSLRLRLLAVKQEDTPFLMDYKPDLSFFTQYSVAYLTSENQAVNSSDIQMQQLYGNRGPYPFFSPGCRCGNHSDPRNGRPNLQNMSQNSCCHVPPADCSTSNCPAGLNCCQSCSDVIESIALTEASIAHILNAEGEKLQKAIACSRNISDLLRVNESVLKTITHSTHLEQVLYCKLEAILNAGCLECHSPATLCCREQNLRDECSEPICES